MTNYDDSQSPDASSTEAVSPAIVGLLAQTRPWVKLMSVLAFVGLGFGVLGLLLAAVVSRAKGHGGAGVKEAVVVAWFSTPLLLLYVPPAVFLWRYAEGIRGVVQGGGPRALEYALRNQKSFWKFVGILALVGIVAYAVLIVGSLGVGFLIGARARHG
jgi:hypothetical protein